MRLNRKILLITIGILFVSLLVTSIVTLVNFRKNYTEALLTGSLGIGQSLNSVIGELLNLGLPLDSLAGMEKKVKQIVANNPHLAYVAIVDLSGKPLFHNDSSLVGKVFDDAVMRRASAAKKPINQVYPRFDGRSYYDVAIPIFDAAGAHAGVIRLGFPQQVVDDKVMEALVQLALSFSAAFLVIAFLINALLSRHVSRPVIRLAELAKDIAAGRCDSGPLLDRGDEIGALSEALNQMAQTLRGQLRQMSEAVKQSQQAIMLMDAQGCFVYVNPAFTQLLGHGLDEIVGQPLSLLAPTIEPENGGDPLPDGSGAFHGKVFRRTRDGHEIPVMLNLTPVLDAAGNVTGHVGVLSDLTDIERRQAQLEHMAQHDALTGLPNRLLLRDRMTQALAQARRRNQLVAICYLDLDGFKPINDTHGHKAGDQILVDVGQRLGRAIRSGDTVARLGGDEFVLILTDFEAAPEIELALDRVQHDIGVPFVIDGAALQLSASIGVVVFPLDDNDTDILLRHADKAMYAAKQAGKNRYFFFDHHEEQRNVNEHEMRNGIQAGLNAGDFRLHYQPKVNMRTGVVVGAEALVRWQHPELGLQAPGTFLPFIENHALIVDLGNWVLGEALRQMRLWQAENIHLDISINVAALQLQQPDFVPRLRALLLAYPDIPPARIELEILETAALADVDMVSRIIDQCQELGIQFAIDDFGTGYSSLTYLKRLAARTLKIDQSFVRDMLDDPEDLAITEGVLGLARAFQRSAIGEGVESTRHGTMLLRLGCDHAQGYGIARPMPPEALPQWLRDFRQHPEWIEAAGQNWARDDFPLLSIEAEHRRWVGRIVLAVKSADATLLPPNVQDHLNCNFGRWLRDDAYVQYRHLPQFKQIEEPHRKIHEVGFNIAAQLRAGNRKGIEMAADELIELRDAVVAALHALQLAVLETRR